MFMSFSCCLELTPVLLSVQLLLLLTNGVCALYYLHNQNTLDSIFVGFYQCCKWNKPPIACDATNSENFFQSSDRICFNADSDTKLVFITLTAWTCHVFTIHCTSYISVNLSVPVNWTTIAFYFVFLTMMKRRFV